MFKKPYLYTITLVSTILPVVTYAATETLATLIDKITGYLNKALFLMMALAVVMFVWYVIQYFIKPNENRTEAGMYVMYSLIGFFVILSFWGLVNILQNTFGLQNEANKPSSWTSFTNLFPGGSSGEPQSYQEAVDRNIGGPFNPGQPR